MNASPFLEPLLTESYFFLVSYVEKVIFLKNK